MGILLGMRRALALAVLLAVAASARAATFMATSVEELARTSEVVVRGRVLDVASRETASGRIVTEVELAVDSAWKGAPAATVRLLVPGGQLGHVALKVDAAPAFAPGDEVVLFLSRAGPALHVNGLALGTFRVAGDEARPEVGGGRAVVLPRALSAGEREVSAMPLAELERRVRAAR